MQTIAIHLLTGRRAGSVEFLPSTVAARLIASGQAQEATAAEVAEVVRRRDGDPDVEHGDPVVQHRDPTHKKKGRR